MLQKWPIGQTLILFIMKDKKIIFFIFLVGVIMTLTGWLFSGHRSYKFLVYGWNGKKYQERDENDICFSAQRVKKEKADIDDDGETEKAFIKNSRAYIEKKGKIIWQSDAKFKAENIVLADIDNDRKIDILVSLWKIGKYGPDLPFWLEKNTNDWSNHFFIYKWQENKIKLFWGSSTLDAPIKEMAIQDVNSDGKNELIVLEGDYDNSNNRYADYLTIWHWNEWRLFNDFRSEKGGYFDLEIQKVENKTYICVKNY